jgi:hypothetical protein
MMRICVTIMGLVLGAVVGAICGTVIGLYLDPFPQGTIWHLFTAAAGAALLAVFWAVVRTVRWSIRRRARPHDKRMVLWTGKKTRRLLAWFGTSATYLATVWLTHALGGGALTGASVGALVGAIAWGLWMGLSPMPNELLQPTGAALAASQDSTASRASPAAEL